MRSPAHVGNKKKDILILGKYSTQGSNYTALTAEAVHSINFTKQGKKFCLSLCYNENNSYLFVEGVKMFQFKAKDSEFVNYATRLGNNSKYFSVGDMMQTGLNGYAYDFLVGF